MPIPQSNYVDITSVVGGVSPVPTRNLGGMFITTNPLCPTGQVLTFNNADDVATYFGSASSEYLRALFYFGWVSKVATRASQISFWFWNSNAATHALIFGSKTIDTLSQFNGISAGQLTLTLGGVTHTLTGIDLSAAANLAAVASDIQTAVRAYSAGGTPWTSATVAYDSTNGWFTFTSGDAAADTIAVTAAPSNDLAGPLGWLTGAKISNGTAAQTVTNNLIQLYTITNNFGSFQYVTPLGLTDTEAAAAWNDALNPNVQFIYNIPVSAANASSWSAALIGISGCQLTLAPLSTEYPEQVPGMILAATNYNARNSVQNYEFQTFTLTPSVTNQTDYNTYKALRVNFYGNTQSAGQVLSFYQQGVMMGLPTDPLDQNVYANEIWFKDALGASLMNLLLALTQVSANNTGRAQILATLQSVIDVALKNGTISVGTQLTNAQIADITAITGDPTAYRQVQTTGYWVNVVFESFVESGITKYKAVYTLIYKKDDCIREIDGSNILI